MSTILKQISDHNSIESLRETLKEIGCDVCKAQSLKDLEKVIQDQAVAGAQVLVNGSLQQGPGMKITQIDKSGYRLMATGEAPTTNAISPTHPVGTPVQQVLFDIVNTMLPKVQKDAMQAPAIVCVDMFKAMADGIDYYQNQAFGRDGAGRKTGLHPNTWYLRMFLYSQPEPLYISLLPMMVDLKSDIISEIVHMFHPEALEEPKEDCGCQPKTTTDIDAVLGTKPCGCNGL